MMKNVMIRSSLGGLVLWSTLAAGGVPITIFDRPFSDDPELLGRLDNLSQLALTNPSGEWEQRLTDAAKKSIGAMITAVPGELIGVNVGAYNGMDIMTSAWNTDSPGVRKIWVLDEPEYNTFVLECEPVPTSSGDSVKSLIGTFIKPDEESFVRLARFEVGFSHIAKRLVAGGYGSISPPYPNGGEIHVFVVRSPGVVLLMLQAGKRLFRYPEEAAYVPERFPPLSSRISVWSQAKLISEVGKMTAQPSPIRYFSNRDEILIQEIVNRGITDQQIETLMSPPAEYDEAYGRRVTAVMKGVIESKQLERHRLAIENATLKIGAVRRDDNRYALESIFRALRDQVQEDYTDLALSCLKICQLQFGPMLYLEGRASTQAAIRAIEQADLPASQEGLRMSVLKEARKRIAANEKGK
jgi:hypothetical protein